MKGKPLVHQERGQSFTELAISLTLLLILLAGTVDLGRAFFTFISLRDSVQEGASYAAFAPNDCAGIIQRIKEHTNQPIDLANDTSVQIVVDVTYRTSSSSTAVNTCSGSGGAAGVTSAGYPGLYTFCPNDQIHVRVTYNNFQIVTPFLGTFLGTQQLPLSADVYGSILMNLRPQDTICP